MLHLACLIMFSFEIVNLKKLQKSINEMENEISFYLRSVQIEYMPC